MNAGPRYEKRRHLSVLASDWRRIGDRSQCIEMTLVSALCCYQSLDIFNENKYLKLISTIKLNLGSYRFEEAWFAFGKAWPKACVFAAAYIGLGYLTYLTAHPT